MNLLLLSINPAAIPDVLDESVPALDRPLRLGYISDAATGMPFADREHAAIAELGHDVIDISARGSDANGFAELLDTLDAMYVASGETFVLLEALRSKGTGDVLARRIRGGLPYIGCSAGSTIAGPSITPAELMDDRGVAPDLDGDEGLGLIDHVVILHADGLLPLYPLELIQQTLATFSPQYRLLPLRDDQAFRVGDSSAEIVPSS